MPRCKGIKLTEELKKPTMDSRLGFFVLAINLRSLSRAHKERIYSINRGS